MSSYGLDVAAVGEPVTLATVDETAPDVLPTAVAKVRGTGPTYTTPGAYLPTLVTTDNDGLQGFGSTATDVVLPGRNVAVYSRGSTSLRNSFNSLGADSIA